MDTTWEPESLIKHKYPHLILESSQFNKTIDPASKQLAEAVCGHHSNLIRMIEKSNTKKKQSEE